MNYRTIKEIVASQLRDDILSGRLPAGKEITLKALAEQYNCSLTPIREALSILEGEGLAVANRHKSVTVCSLDADEVEEIFEIRALLEGYACSLAIANMDEKTLENLEANLHAQKMCAEKDEHNRWVKLNSEFHNQIYSCIRKGILYEMIMTLRNRTGHYGRTYTKLLNRTKTATLEHEQLLDAILKRDRAKANRITQKHLRSLGRTLKPYLLKKRISK